MSKHLLKVRKLVQLIFFFCALGVVRAETDQPKIKVACIGNSITYGYGLPARSQHAYPSILQQMLGRGYDVRNFGISGRTLLQKGDYPYMKESAYAQAKAFQPDIVTIKLGTNDSKPHNWKYKKDFQHDLETMVKELSALPSHPEIYLCLPIPSTKEGFTTINDSTLVHGVIPLIRKVAKHEKVHLIDLHTPLKPYPQYLADHIHPNVQGSALIAREIYRSLTGKEAPDYDALQPFPGVKSTWKGYDRYDFTFLGRDALVVVPEKPAPGRPWIWRPAFFGAFPMVDEALLKKGFHVAYYDLTHLYGSPRSLYLGNRFYEIMTRDYRLSSKVTLEGLSRGGYFAFNWAAANPAKIACLYVDAPVCDITSWPGKGRTEFWNGFLKEWNVKDAASGHGFRGNALALVSRLAQAHLPIIAVCGDSDRTVPYVDNLKPFMEAYQALGGPIELILKPGCDHHPHSLKNPEPIVDFILRYQEGENRYRHIHRRGSLSNSFQKFRNEKKGCVAFLGGSITFRRGWKDQIKESLKQRFPETDFQFIDAGIGSTGSTPHAFRLEHDVLEKGTPDLLFFEAAVNDDTNGFSAVNQVRGMEGIARHLRTLYPQMDLVMLHFIHDPFIPLLQQDIEPDVIMNHERVANAYYITSINLAREVAERMKDGQFTWQQFGGVHPCWNGSKNYSATINHLFDIETLALAANPEVKSHRLPVRPLDKYSYDKGGFISLDAADKLRGFSYEANWMPAVHVKANLRPGFHHVPMLEARKAGASFRLEFDGNAVGIFCVAGPSAGILSYEIDGRHYPELNLYTPWSRNLYLPWLYLLGSELDNGHHVLTARLKKGKGEECQIRNFVVNRN